MSRCPIVRSSYYSLSCIYTYECVYVCVFIYIYSYIDFLVRKSLVLILFARARCIAHYVIISAALRVYILGSLITASVSSAD